MQIPQPDLRIGTMQSNTGKRGRSPKQQPKPQAPGASMPHMGPVTHTSIEEGYLNA